ncbi:integrase [Vibrio cholerae]|nr:integrase [Vibrio cholerae]
MYQTEHYVTLTDFPMPQLERKRQICSGQLKLATVLEFSQYNRSDSLGVRPPLY